MGWQAVQDAYAASRERSLRLAESALAVALAFHQNEATGLCFPSFEVLRSETGMSLKTLRSALKSLVDAGLVSYRRGMIGAPTYYTLHFSTVQICTVQKDTVQKVPVQGAVLPPVTGQFCTPNKEINKEVNKEAVHAPEAPASEATKRRRVALPCPAGISSETWGASNAIRKSKRVGAWTPKAWELAVAAGKACGMAPSEMLDYCISRGWACFREDYFRPANNNSVSAPKRNLDDYF